MKLTKIYFSLLLFSLMAHLGNSQNLVPNPSFENEVSCFTMNAGFQMPEIDYAIGWDMPTMGTSDHFHPCHTGGFGQFTPPNTWIGYTHAADGNSFAGFMTHENSSVGYKEYMQAPLTSSLIAGEVYTIGFYYSLAEGSQFASDGLGMLLQNGAISQPASQSVINATPQLETTTIHTDTAGWTLVTGLFTATGGEDHVVIGCFVDDASLGLTSTGFGTNPVAYYFIDSVFVSTGCATSISAPDTLCQNAQPIDLQAFGTGVWSGNGITDTVAGTFDPITAGVGTHQIIYTISGSCNAADTAYIEIMPEDTTTFFYSDTIFCSHIDNPLPTIMGLSNGEFTIDNNGVIDPVTGEIDITASGTGQFEITYTTGSPCGNPLTFPVEIMFAPSPNIAIASMLCENDSPVTPNFLPAGGVWSGTGITDSITGAFDPAVADTGLHELIYTLSDFCGNSDTAYVQVNSSGDPDFHYSQNPFTINQNDPSAIIVGTSGGNFTINNGGIIDSITGAIDLDQSGIGTYLITYTTPPPCSESYSLYIEITDVPSFDAPNVFTPNGDGQNDEFKIPEYVVNSFNGAIYNRWGTKVFEWYDIYSGWDGTINGNDAPEGTYYYLINITAIDGEHYSINGHVQLLR